MPRVFIGIGSNLGDRLLNLSKAVVNMSMLQHYSIYSISSVYETEPVGEPEQNYFLNAVFQVQTNQNPEHILKDLHKIENDLGRTRGLKWGPRTIDLDILAMDNVVLNYPNLVIPHAELHARRFVLVPFDEIAPNYTVNGLNKTVHQLLKECLDQNKVTFYNASHALQKKLKEVQL